MSNYTLSINALAPHQLVSELIDLDFAQWNLAPIAHLLTPTETQAIHAIQLSSDLTTDYLIWSRDRSGNYSVRSGYHFRHSFTSRGLTHDPNTSHQVNPSVWTWIWKVNTLPKIKIFLWRLVNNSLATKDNLFFVIWPPLFYVLFVTIFLKLLNTSYSPVNGLLKFGLRIPWVTEFQLIKFPQQING